MPPLLLLLLLLLAGCEGDPPPPPPREAPPEAPEEGVLRLAGTGAMIRLGHRLAEAWAATERGGEARLVVEASVGSGGGVRAARDGAVDLGMISRPLTQSERGWGLVETPVARAAVVIAAHPSLPLDGLSTEELTRLHAGEPLSAPDGTRVTLLLRDREESANTALERLVPGLKEHRERAYRTRRFRVLYHDEAMREALASTPGAVGVVDLGAATATRSRLRLLALDGAKASREAIRRGDWKAVRTLAFVHRADRAGRVAGFLAFVASPEGRALIEDNGDVPEGP